MPSQSTCRIPRDTQLANAPNKRLVPTRNGAAPLLAGTAAALGCREQYEFGIESPSASASRVLGRQLRASFSCCRCLLYRSATSFVSRTGHPQ